MAFQFPEAKVHITTNSPDGSTATFIPPAQHPSQPLGPTHRVTYIYATPPSPFAVDSNEDLDYYTEKSTSGKPLSVFPQEGATGCVILGFAPALEGAGPFIHKTNTVDYVVVLEGVMELELGGGEKRLLQKGEVVIQRACWHSLTNASTTEGARILAVAVGEKGAIQGKMELPGGGPPKH